MLVFKLRFQKAQAGDVKTQTNKPEIWQMIWSFLHIERNEAAKTLFWNEMKTSPTFPLFLPEHANDVLPGIISIFRPWALCAIYVTPSLTFCCFLPQFVICESIYYLLNNGKVQIIYHSRLILLSLTNRFHKIRVFSKFYSALISVVLTAQTSTRIYIYNFYWHL